MNRILEFLAGNPWLNLMFLALAVLGIGASYVFYRKSIRSKSVVFSSSSFNLIHESLSVVSGLSIRYKERDVGRLTVNRIAIWNKGREPVRRFDIAEGDPLRIEVVSESVEILSATISQSTSKSNNFTLTETASGVLMSFDYLNFGDGVSIDIFHTGVPGKSLTVLGTIIGGDELAFATSSDDGYLDRIIQRIMSTLPRPKSLLPRKVISYTYGILFMPLILGLFLILWPYSYYRFLSDRSPRSINPFSLGRDFNPNLRR
jgi:hypothetical protein